MIWPHHQTWSPSRYVRNIAHGLALVSEAIRVVTAVVWAVALVGTIGFVGLLVWNVVQH